ncbi:uncharacterized protein Z520_07413 [Fonsecaea multimorphosa CBS 102226]|uniref:Methyltransferase domain-containing protein n=1 Tax=Fonsecaea multimorphosa CBS 102226 TaxID=1442371 RepID=A0A0D2K109_9EURO|nr:uncharacterized protein Z520_07413 [Fonsecaea multimorphosa CBS 102226]KIX96694.1 hypothetical protein Z520_07413 [Fonsecaea multimorphosa CBS 102226]OAL22749.1 hypothetical protein AYO22_06931 [Fonsecaea multimorphosa]
MSTRTDEFIAETLAQYTPRAANYDLSNGGWHVELGRDFVTWLPPPKGGAVLDLACGTGLVTIPQAEAVGPGGIVIGVDITKAMLNEAKRKSLPEGSSEVKWLLGDITNLSSVEEVQKVVKERGGFDVISCCSAFVLLENPAEVIKHWVTFLKPSTGRLIVDVPTEDRNLQYLLNYPLRRALGKPMVYNFDWIEGLHTLQTLFEDAGLEIEKSFRTRSYVPEKWYGADQAMDALDEKTSQSGLWKRIFDGLQSEGGTETIDKARQAWVRIWKDHLNEDGKLWDGHALYVSIGRRRE